MTLNVGLEMAMELGEHWLSPITARLMARYPDMSPGTRPATMSFVVVP
jgi:hypothetical protein